MYLGKFYTCKDGVFGLQCSGTDSIARMYQNKRFVTFKRDNLRYLMNMIHLFQVQQTRYIPARDDVVEYALVAPRSREFVEPQSAVCGLIFYDQLFYELKNCSSKTIV
jgi:hypothetical protein